MTFDYCFGTFRLDPENQRLWHGPQEIILRPKSFAVLHHLVTQRGRLVTREEVLQAVWPGVAVSDAVLTVCIGEIRQALQDSHQAPQFIETVHRRGYRFRSAITVELSMASVSGPKRLSESPPPTITPSPLALGAQHSSLETVPGVGRVAQVSQLECCLQQARSGVRQIVLLAGEAGLGKTALVDMFLTQVTSGLPLWVARGQCIAHYGAGEAYLPVLDALGRLCRDPESASLVAALERYAPTWLVQMPALLAPDGLEPLQRRVQGTSRECMLRELAEAVEVLTIEQMHARARAIAQETPTRTQHRRDERIVGVVEYRDGSVIDVITQVQNDQLACIEGR